MGSTRMDNNQAGRYNSASRVRQVVRHTGLFVLPVAEEAPSDPELRKKWSPVSIVRAHGAYQEEVDSFAYEKEDAPPVVPDMTDAGKLTFLGGELAVPTPGINTAGGMTWTVAGEYAYVSTASVDELKKTGVVIGSHPFVLTSQRKDAVVTGPSSATDLPPEVEAAGLGPKVGWQLATGGTTDTTAADYTYREPTLLPGSFFSDELTVGPTDYSGMGDADYEFPTEGELVSG